MSRLAPIEREVLDLVWKMASERMSAEDAYRLEQIVVENSEGRSAYLAASDLVAGLEWGEIESKALGSQWTVGDDDALEPQPEIGTVAEVFGVELSERPSVAPAWRRIPRWFSSSPARAILAVACVYYAVAAGLFYSASMRPQTPHAGRDGSLAQVANSGSTVPPPPTTNAPYLIRLTGGKNIRWRYPDIPVEIGSDLPSGELELVQGVAEVTFGGGALVSLKAPAQLTVTSAGSARLHRGHISAHVPSKAVGFRIQTLTTEVVDLGTDFSVDVSEAGETQVWVHSGLVELQSRFKLAGESEPRRQRLRGGEYLRVASLTRGTPVAVTSAPADQFVRRVSIRRDPMLVEQGGSFAPGNLALLPTAEPFATKCLDHPGHSIIGLCDGHYGNSSSWIAEAEELMFAGVRFGGNQTISSIAFGRDNGNDLPGERPETYIDRSAGTYTVQITTAETPDVTTPDSDWITLGTISQGAAELDIASGRFKPYLRHRYAFAPVEATGVRIIVSDFAIAIDELEVYGVE